MKMLRVIFLMLPLLASSSCSFFNKRTVDLSIDSSPSGASIFINGQNYGQTPAVVSIEPKAYDVVLEKEGYGSTNFKTEIWWGTVRTDVNGRTTPDGTRCLLDMLSLVFSFNAYNAAKCGDFKQKKYSIVIPRVGSGYGASYDSPMGAGGVNNYYYNQSGNRAGSFGNQYR